MTSIGELGKAAGLTVRKWLECLVEFVEGYREGAGNLDELTEKLEEKLEKK